MLFSVAIEERSGTNVTEELYMLLPIILDAEDASDSVSLIDMLDASGLSPPAPPAAAIICGLKGLEDVLATLPFRECW